MRIRSHPFAVRIAFYLLPVLAIIFLLGAFEQVFVARHSQVAIASPSRSGPVNWAFEQAASEFHVPAVLLKTICYMEGRLSNNGGWPSRDNGFGCMHLVKNRHVDMLDRAARELGVSVRQLKLDMPTNIRGGAILLRDYALQLSHTHSLPGNLNDWYGAVAAYSNSTTRSTALMYANAAFQIMHQGFSAQADDGEMITLPSQAVRPNTATADAVKGSGRLPTGCRLDQHVDYPGAVDCIVPANSFDCNKMQDSNAPCTYEDAKRPGDYAIDLVVIHDIEGTAESALNVFQNVQSQASVHYIVDSDGTVYQAIKESDIAYHGGNYWYNQHSIGIEHAGVDATGYRWYNAAEYLASAKLVAYLLKKYTIPLDHEHIVSHGTVPSPTLADEPNHVDPGPYWLWDYYFKLIHEQGVPYPDQPVEPHVFTLHPKGAQRPFGVKGTETSSNYNFFYLYNGPSTASGRIPQLGGGMGMIDETGNVEPDISYYYLSRVTDPAGNGDMMYKIWYGEQNQTQGLTHARLAWLAVPRGAASPGQGATVALHADNGHTPQVYGRPTTDKQYIIGDAPAGAIFVSSYTVIEDGTNTGNGNGNGNTGGGTGNGNTGNGNGNGSTGGGTGNGNTGSGSRNSTGNLWYEINYNHRQAWVPSAEVTLTQPGSGPNPPGSNPPTPTPPGSNPPGSNPPGANPPESPTPPGSSPPGPNPLVTPTPRGSNPPGTNPPASPTPPETNLPGPNPLASPTPRGNNPPGAKPLATPTPRGSNPPAANPPGSKSSGTNSPGAKPSSTPTPGLKAPGTSPPRSNTPEPKVIHGRIATKRLNLPR